MLIDIQAAHIGLADLIERARAGEEIIIARDGQPVVKLVPVRRNEPERRFGALAGRLVVTPAFFEPLPVDSPEASFDA